MPTVIQAARMVHRKLHRNVEMPTQLGRCAMVQTHGGLGSVRLHAQRVHLACALAGSPENVIHSAQIDSVLKSVQRQIKRGTCVMPISGGDLSAKHIAPLALRAPLDSCLHRTPPIAALITSPCPVSQRAGSTSWQPLMHLRTVVLQEWNQKHLRLHLGQHMVKG